MKSNITQEMQDLAAFIDAAPSPSHACQGVVDRLSKLDFVERPENESWDNQPGRYYCLRGDSVLAWVAPDKLSKDAGFRLIGAHTDSPNLRIKPQPDRARFGIHQLGVEIYGGALLNSWLDRDLGVSGKVWIEGKTGLEE